MYKNLQYPALFILVVLLFTGCSHQVALQKDTLQPEQTVTAKLANGDKISGTVASVSDQEISIVTKQNTTRNVESQQISELTGPTPVYDADGRLISDKEIAGAKKNSKFWTYTLSGGLVSAGASFFLSSMIAKSSSDDIEDPIIISGTAAGTVVGGYLFSRWGKQKDREDAIESIRLTRGSGNLENLDAEQERQQKIQQELERVKKEREQQEEEIKKLQEKIKNE